MPEVNAPENASLLRISPVIPVVTLEDPEDAAPLARALYEGGIGIIELTLRTERALECLARIAEEVPETCVGAGTILTPEQADAAVAAGAQFLVSRGTTGALLDHLLELPVPVLPGAATVSEAMALLERGVTEMKFFPAAPAGGPAYLKAVGAPVPQVTFCPTGGISLETAPDYLGLSNVACIGGSWLTPADAVRDKDWGSITQLAREAAALSSRG
ncbi:bifunctional 4-hydroxy-2-oxoglutarate aldolase/2-dehydro-3-deoxy-phosphogluconate aldolase [Zhihengliuella somnathii]